MTLDVGLHLICVNVAMTGIRGMNASDCIFANVVLSPLVAQFTFGVRRRVGFGQQVEMDAGSDSYDPDVHLIAKSVDHRAHSDDGFVQSNFTFSWSFMLEIEGDNTTIATDSQQADIIFEGPSTSELYVL